jgi:hypothetical protein
MWARWAPEVIERRKPDKAFGFQMPYAYYAPNLPRRGSAMTAPENADRVENARLQRAKATRVHVAFTT